MKTALCLIFLFTSFSLFGQKSELLNKEWIGGFCTHLKFEEDSCQVFSDGEKYAYTATDSTLYFTKRAKGCSGFYYEIQNDTLQLSHWDYWRLPDRGPCGRHLLFSPRLLKRKTKDFQPFSPFDSLQTYSRSFDFALNDQREFSFKLGNPSVENQDYNLPGYYSGKLSERQWEDLIDILDKDCNDMYSGVIEKYPSGQSSLKIWYDSLKRNMILNKAEEFTKYLYQKIPTYTSYPSDKTGARDTIPRVLVDRSGHFESDYVKGKVQKSFYDSESKKYYYSFRPIEGYVNSLKPGEKHTGKGRLMLLYSLVRIPEDSLVGIILKHTDEGEINFQKTRKRGLNIRYLKVDGVYPIKNHKVIFKGRFRPSRQHPITLHLPPNKKLFTDWRWRMSDLGQFLKKISEDYIEEKYGND